MSITDFEIINVFRRNNNKRAVYFREYGPKYGDLMREQIKEWFTKHPEYLKNILCSGVLNIPITGVNGGREI